MSSLVKVRGYATASPPNARSIGPDVTPHRITTEAPEAPRSRARWHARTLPKGDERRRKDEHLERKNSFSSRRPRRPRRRARRRRGVRLLRVALVIVALGLLFPPPACAAAAAAAAVRSRGAARPARARPRAGDVDGFRLLSSPASTSYSTTSPVSFVRLTRKNASVEGGGGVRARGAPAQRGGDDSVRRDSRKNNGIVARGLTLREKRHVRRAAASKTENRNEHWALSPPPPRGADGDAGEPSKRRDRVRRGRPRAGFSSARPNRARRRFRVSSVFPRVMRARALRSRARAPRPRARALRARAREKKRAKARSFASARKLREPAAARRAAYLAQGAEPLGVDRGLVHENLFRAVVGGDEPETLLGVEPLHLRASPAEGASGNARRSHRRRIHRSLLSTSAAERSAARRRGAARRERRGRSSRVRRRRHTLPVSTSSCFAVELRLERAARGAMPVGGCFRRASAFLSAVSQL